MKRKNNDISESSTTCTYQEEAVKLHNYTCICFKYTFTDYNYLVHKLSIESLFIQVKFKFISIQVKSEMWIFVVASNMLFVTSEHSCFTKVQKFCINIHMPNTTLILSVFTLLKLALPPDIAWFTIQSIMLKLITYWIT